MPVITRTPPADSPAPVAAGRAHADDDAVTLHAVHKAYERGGARTPVLAGCSLSVRRGECVFLVGPSGSGKTTVLSIIGCVLHADSGRVRIFGEDVAALSKSAAAELRRTQIGFVFQKYHLVNGLSALENVCLPLVLDGVSRSVAERRGRELLSRVGLADKLRADPRRLSVGQCQRVAVARALVADPPLILADEPTASLDADHGQQAMRLLRELTTEQGKTAIIVTHDPRIEAFADRTLVMERGLLSERARDGVTTGLSARNSTHDISLFSPERPGRT
jgi:putative ABC transport system ATP-binding protein